MPWKFILRSSQPPRARKQSQKTVYRPKLEELENRQLLAVTTSVFAIDPNSSQITLSGDIGGNTVLPQGSGSLTTSYTGSVVADWDLAGQTIQFDSTGTALNALNSGNWQPMPGGVSGTAPANYGGQVSIVIFPAYIALRNLVVGGFTNSPLALSGAGAGSYNFPSTQTLQVLSGTADYYASILGAGTTDLTGLFNGNQSQVPGTLTDLGNGSYTLTEPINFTFQKVVDGFLTTLHVNGQIIANAALPVVNLTDGTGSSFDYATSAIGGGGSVAVEDPAATVTGTPVGNLTSMTVTLINHPDDTAEFLNVGYDFTNSGLAVTGYDPTTGQLVITGSADPSVYQAILRTISYEDDSLTPDTSNRIVQFTVSDGVNASVVRTTTVSVSAPASPAPPPGLMGTKPVLPNSIALEESAVMATPIPLFPGEQRFVSNSARSSESMGRHHSELESNVPVDHLSLAEPLAGDLGGFLA